MGRITYSQIQISSLWKTGHDRPSKKMEPFQSRGNTNLDTNLEKMIIELFSGLGRFETDEEVIYIGIQRETKPTICADVRFLPLRPKLRPSLCLACPPCTFVSKARWWARGISPGGLSLYFELLSVTWKAFYYLQPKLAILEQPAGIEKFLGEKIQVKYDKADYKAASENFYFNSKKSLKRAIIPKWVRDGLLAFSE